ncbi:MAG: hypothetical protein DCF16_07505 [Alphaproteobacteria bacterium]|nr:MAG: hypothetical protein DCF16_07505 [Alphaproteobacteria bacterium]
MEWWRTGWIDFFSTRAQTTTDWNAPTLPESIAMAAQSRKLAKRAKTAKTKVPDIAHIVPAGTGQLRWTITPGSITPHLAIEGAYRRQRPLYEDFTRSVSELVRQLLATEKLEGWFIESRAKSLPSLREKLARPGKEAKYDQLSDVTDLAGVRIVALLQEDHDKICKIVEHNFAIDRENSSDKETALDPDRFGYLSTHFITTYDARRTDLPEFARFKGLKVELQVRTVLQHAWAAIDWKLRYKSKADIPAPVLRRLFRISALLEAADDEFSAVTVESAQLRHLYQKQLAAGELDNIPVNADSMKLYLETSAHVAALLAKARAAKLVEIADIADVGRNAGRLSSLVFTVRRSGMRRIEQLDHLLRTNQTKHIRCLKAIYGLRADTPANKLTVETLIRLIVISSLDEQLAWEALSMTDLRLDMADAMRAFLTKRAELLAPARKRAPKKRGAR